MKDIEVVFQNDTVSYIDFEETPRLGETVLIDKIEYIVTKIIHKRVFGDLVYKYQITQIEVT